MLKKIICIIYLPSFIFTLIPQVATAAGKSTLDGFKEIKFGLSVSELTGLGYKCSDYGVCELKDGVEKEYTLFSQPARVSVDIEHNKVSSIDVSIDVPPDKMKELFSKSLGNPKVHKYVSFTGYMIEQYYWLFSNGTSISVRKNLDSNTTRNIFGQVVPVNFSRAEYKGKQETNALVESVRKATADKNDF